jgi:DNA-binding MarR family transcriptional regulator
MEREVNDYFREITQGMYAKTEEKLEKYGLVKGQSQLLHLIKENDGSTQKDLANYFNIKYSSMSQRINKLEALGYIKRVHEDGNFKNNRIYITKEGKLAATQCKRINNDIEKKMYKGISKKDIQIFENVLIKMTDNINK